jgi:hypothetical protein
VAKAADVVGLHGPPRRSFTAVEQLQEHIDTFITACKRDNLAIRLDQEKVYPRRFKNRRIIQL